MLIPRWLQPDTAKGYRWWTLGYGRIETVDGPSRWLKLGPVTFTRYRWFDERHYWIDLCARPFAWRIWPLPPFRWNAKFGPQ